MSENKRDIGRAVASGPQKMTPSEAFIETLVDKSTKTLDVKWDDELVKATALTRDGAVIHPNFQPKT